MGYVDPNRLGIVTAVLLTAWHGVWLALVASGQAQRVADFVLRMHSMKSDVVVEPFNASLAALLLATTAALGYVAGVAGVAGVAAAALWNCLGTVCAGGRTAGKAGMSARV